MAALAERESRADCILFRGLGPELFEPHFLRYGQEPDWASGATYLKHPGTLQEVEALGEVLERGGEAIREEVSDAPSAEALCFPSSSRMPGAPQNGLFGFVLSTRTCLWPFSQSHGMWVLPRKEERKEAGQGNDRSWASLGPQLDLTLDPERPRTVWVQLGTVRSRRGICK